MLPLLEDSVLARRAAERPMSLHELLLYSAVCGTGLDTIPLPGDISEAEFARIEHDVLARIREIKGPQQAPIGMSRKDKVTGVEIETHES